MTEFGFARLMVSGLPSSAPTGPCQSQGSLQSVFSIQIWPFRPGGVHKRFPEAEGGARSTGNSEVHDFTLITFGLTVRSG